MQRLTASERPCSVFTQSSPPPCSCREVVSTVPNFIRRETNGTKFFVARESIFWHRIDWKDFLTSARFFQDGFLKLLEVTLALMTTWCDMEPDDSHNQSVNPLTGALALHGDTYLPSGDQ